MTQQRKPRKVLDEKGFRHGKQLLSAGAFSSSEIADILGVSTSTVGRIRTAETLTEMKQKNAETTRRSYAKRHAAEQMPAFEQEETQSEQPSSEPQPSGKPAVSQKSEADLIAENTMYTLERIANAVERLADAWEKSPEKKKGIFRG